MTPPKPRYTGIIFDLDGTLVDSLQDLTDACNQAITAAGCRPLTCEEMKPFIGYGAFALVSGAVRVTFPDWTGEQIEPVFQAYRKYYQARWHKKTSLYPGISELLSDLKRAGVKLAVLSNKPHDSTLAMVNYYFDQNLFDFCYGQIDAWPVKPDPALALRIAGEMGLEPADMALIGDSGSDLQTAARAGMTGIGVLYGFRDRQDLNNGGPVQIADQPTDLKPLLFELDPSDMLAKG